MIWLLLVIFQIKHFLADYPLQNSYMLGKFKGGTAWIKPLAAHCVVHAVFTGIIASWIKPELSLPLALLDFVLHFLMDRMKASPDLFGQFKALSGNEYKDKTILRESYEKLAGQFTDFPEIQSYYAGKVKEFDRSFASNTLFWWALGFDQMVHHLTHYLIIFLLLR